MIDNQQDFLKKALILAQKKRGFCAPNPAVGVVVVKNHQIIAEGYHSGIGEMHAEAVALQTLSLEATTGSTVYVTLEPCCHQGRTPPCTDLLIRHRVKAVYYGFTDPNPLVSGKGQQQLQAAGIHCIHTPLPEIDAFYQSYLYWTETQRPWVTAKLAMSLDGKIAGKNGEPIAITGEQARLFTHQWRKQSDAILTTVKTVIHDDPKLNVRLPEGTYSKPVYVLDTRLEFPKQAQLFKTAKTITVFYAEPVEASRKRWLEEQGVTCVPIHLKNGVLDPHEVLAYLGERGVHDLLMEVGGVCFESWALQKDQIDYTHHIPLEKCGGYIQRAFIYVALKWLGSDMQSAFCGTTSLFTLAHSLKWHVLGEDVACEFLLTEPKT